jgi:acetyltransferase
MGSRYLAGLFAPRSIAVIGATNAPRKAGYVVMRNLLSGGFQGPVMPVNPKHQAVAGVLGYPDVASLPVAPDLAIIATPPSMTPQIVDELGRRGARAAIVLWSDVNGAGAGLRRIERETVAVAAAHRCRLVGPDSIGVLIPGMGLNASLSQVFARKGKLAFVSQSGDLCTSVLDWAHGRGIGFSHFLSLGACIDVDIADALAVLGDDPDARAILLYAERFDAGRRFVTAARHAARNKPVIVVKPGDERSLRDMTGEQLATLTEMMVGVDDVHDAVFRRTGLLRVHDVDELFAATETLARARRTAGRRLAVVSNGAGLGDLAHDAHMRRDGQFATFNEETAGRLADIQPKPTFRRGQVCLDVAADGAAYARTIEALAADDQVDAALVIHSPNAACHSSDAAQAVITALGPFALPVLTSWIGGESVAEARRAFVDAGIPTYDTPSQAVQGFRHLVAFYEGQAALKESPPAPRSEFVPRMDEVRAIVDPIVAVGAPHMLSGPAAKAILTAYGVPAVQSRIAGSPERAGEVAAELGFPVGLVVISPSLTHKWEAGGVILQLATKQAVVAAARQMLDAVRVARPDARIEGFSLQAMTYLPHARQLAIGAANDPVFGPVVVFGHGGRSADQLNDHAVGLAPLNLPLARDLILRTRAHRLLEPHNGRPAVDMDVLAGVIVKLSQLIVDFPEIAALDINPMLAVGESALVVDAQMRIDRRGSERRRALSILPYPREIEESIRLRDGTEVRLRAISPDDKEKLREMMARVSGDDLRLRFLRDAHSIDQIDELARATQADYDREMSFVATRLSADGREEALGVATAIRDADPRSAEFSLLVRSDMGAIGLGRALLDKVVRYCRAQNISEVVGHVLAENQRMLAVARRLAFAVEPGEATGLVIVRLAIDAGDAGAR